MRRRVLQELPGHVLGHLARLGRPLPEFLPRDAAAQKARAEAYRAAKDAAAARIVESVCAKDKDEPCRHCGENVPSKEMSTLCTACRVTFKMISMREGLDAAEAWVRDLRISSESRASNEP
jgi:hypothetical protein